MALLLAVPFLIMGALDLRKPAIVAGVGVSLWMWWGFPIVQLAMVIPYYVGYVIQGKGKEEI